MSRPTPNRDTVTVAVAKSLWRYSRADRRRIVEAFVGRWVFIDRWYSRVASGGDIQYRGELVALAVSTIGTAADLLIVKTIDGTTWAISAAQVALLSAEVPSAEVATFTPDEPGSHYRILPR